MQGSGGLRQAVEAVTGPAVDAAKTADSPLLGTLGVIPVLGNQVDGLRDITDLVAEIATVADSEVDAVEERLDNTGEPAGRVALVEEAVSSVDTIQTTLEDLPEIEDGRLIGPLKSAANELEAELDDATGSLEELRTHLTSARDLLVGPSRILVLAANNGEVRAGMGMHLSAGVITLENGDFTTSDFAPTQLLTEVTDGEADIPEELESLYGSIWDFGHEWRTTSSSPNFPVVGSVFEQLSERSVVGDVDVVMSIDVPGLANILQATGPVEVDGRRVAAENAVDLLLRDNYLELGEPSETAERRQLQSQVATEIFDTITARDIDLFDLAAAVQESAAGRNLLAWSTDPGVQALWESLGADGALTEDSFMVAFQNASASKRDYFITPSVTVVPVGELRVGEPRRFRIDAELTNPVVEPTVPYFDSLNQFVPVGIHRAWVTFTLPAGAHDIEVQSGRHSRTGKDGPVVVVAVWLRVAESETGVASIEFTVPAGVNTVELLPAARVNPTPYRFGPVEVLDTQPTRVPLPIVASLEPPEVKLFHALTLVFAFSGVLVLVARSRRLAIGTVIDEDEGAKAAARSDAYTAAGIFALALVSLALAIAA